MTESILDNREKIKELDKSNVLGSIEELPNQIKDAWTEASKIEIPASYKAIKNILVVGMGGSALGSNVIKHLYKSDLTIPFEIIHHYALPEYVNSDTLVLLSSYSGTTEEVLEAANSAIEKQAKIIIIASGGKLGEIAEKNNLPYYKINPKYNPSNQPRMAVGYAIAGQLALFKSFGIIDISNEEINKVFTGLENTKKNLSPDNTEGNTAKFLSYAAFHKIVAIISAEHLIGAAHVFNNQINENAKNLTLELEIPELNHHYMEGLSFPTSVKEDIIFIFFQSNLYHHRVIPRVTLTHQLVVNKEYPTELVTATAPTRLEQVFEIIQLGSYTNFYLAMLNGIDPSPIPTVDWFKSELAKV